MNEAVRIDEYAFWRAQLAHQDGQGPAPETERGQPKIGFYRTRPGAAVAIWRDEDGLLHCSTSHGYCPAQDVDAIDDFFGQVCRNAVTYEAYTVKANGGKWPDEVPDLPQESEPAENERAVMGGNNPPEEMTPDRSLLSQIERLGKQAKDWLLSIGGIPKTKVEADLVANYASKFAELEKQGDAAHRAEKEEILKLSKAIDEKWREPREAAKLRKNHLKDLVNVFINEENIRRVKEAAAENKRRAEEAAKLNAELERQAAEQRAPNALFQAEAPVVPVTPVAPAFVEPERVKVGARSISQRKVITGRITDRKALFAYLGEMAETPPALVDPIQKLINKWAQDGAQIPGVERVETTKAQ